MCQYWGINTQNNWSGWDDHFSPSSQKLSVLHDMWQNVGSKITGIICCALELILQFPERYMIFFLYWFPLLMLILNKFWCIEVKSAAIYHLLVFFKGHRAGGEGRTIQWPGREKKFKGQSYLESAFWRVFLHWRSTFQ